MITIYKREFTRNIKDRDLPAYQAAGWTTKKESPKGRTVLVEEPVVLQPTIDATPIVTSNIGDANDKEK